MTASALTTTNALSILLPVIGSGTSLVNAVTQLNDALASVQGTPYAPVLVLQENGETFTMTLASEGGAGLLLDATLPAALSVVLISGQGTSLQAALGDLNQKLALLSGRPASPVTIATAQSGQYSVTVVTTGGAGLLLLS